MGYQVARDKCVSEDTRIVYVTTGVLLQQLIGTKNMNQYTHIVIDEVKKIQTNQCFVYIYFFPFFSFPIISSIPFFLIPQISSLPFSSFTFLISLSSLFAFLFFHFSLPLFLPFPFSHYSLYVIYRYMKEIKTQISVFLLSVSYFDPTQDM